MFLFTVAMASDVATQASSNAVDAPNPLISMVPMIAIFLVFYFLLIKPQMKKQKEVQNMVSSLKKGDKVVAAGGIIGKIAKIEDNLMSIEIDANTKIQVLKSSVTELIDNKSTEK